MAQAQHPTQAPAGGNQQQTVPETSAPSQSDAETDDAGMTQPILHRAHVSLRYGRVIGTLTGGGLEGFWSLSPDLEVGAVYYQAYRDLRNDVSEHPGVEVEHFRADGRLVLLLAKYNFMPWLFAGGGAGLRDIGFEMDISDSSGSGRMSSQARSRSVVVHALLGSLWAFESGLLVGLDWYGLTMPVKSGHKSEVTTEGTATESLDELFDIVDRAARRLGRAPSDQLLVVNVGLRF